MNRPLIIGLTGGIGSGKTTVSRLFEDLGVPVIDTDILSREVVEPGKPAYDRIVSVFGSDILDNNGRLQREQIRERIYRDRELKDRLEAIIHPEVIQEMQDRISGLDYPYCIAVIPLLLEAGLADRVDRVLVVDTDESSQLDRAMSRDNRTKEEIQSIIESQANRKERTSRADDVIDNSSGTGPLHNQVRTLHDMYLSLCHRSDMKVN